MKFLLIIAFFTIPVFPVQAQNAQQRPKVGLTLSGGGAKGLAHIGILKAIDSAGLKIDYITGTSVGAVLGALYASGYSGKQIEQKLKHLDWDELLSNQLPLQTLSMEEKKQYSRFALDLPYINKKIKLNTGLIQGQELSIILSELFFPLYNRYNFKDFPIPFQCMATNLETGDLVVLDSGNIVTALRASMAIPSIFSAVTINNKKLVDGGLVRNFPVKNVIDMGADITIGSNVSAGLSSIDKISNPVDVILQMAFFKEAIDFKEEIPLTDIYIYMPLSHYTMNSFKSDEDIIKIGEATGMEYLEIFKKLTDSLNQFSASAEPWIQQLQSKPVFIASQKVHGLKNTTEPFFYHLMDFKDSRYYTAEQISKKLRRAYGSRYYSNISYKLIPMHADTAIIEFQVEENPSTLLKTGLYYSLFRGINVHANVTTRDFIFPNSRSIVSLSLGEAFQLETEHLQYFGRKKNIAAIGGFSMDRLNIDAYNDFRKEGSYKQTYYKSFVNLQNGGNNRIAAGIGTSFELIQLSPNVPAEFETKGRLSAVKSYTYINYNSLNQTFYPTNGTQISSELGIVYNQTAKLNVFRNGILQQESGLDLSNYLRWVLDGQFYLPLQHKMTIFSEFQAGINFTNKSNVLNNFQIGGITGKYRNQIRFAGMQEAATSAPRVVSLQIGMRYTLFNNIYLVGRVNGLVKDFNIDNNLNSGNNFLSGYALTFAYKSPIGPIELSAMYSEQSGKLQSYVSFGIPF